MECNSLQTVPERPAEKAGTCICVIAERRYLSQAQPRGMIEGLKALGHSVLVIDPEDSVFDAGDHGWMRHVDVAVARGRSWSVLCLLEWLERQSVPVVNPRSAIAAVHNKADMAVVLASGGIPTPRTRLGSPHHIAGSLTDTDFPVIVKPVFGDNGRGLEVVWSLAQLAGLNWPEPLAIVQSFIPGITRDLKLYCIGREVWAVRKVSPLWSRWLPHLALESPELVPMTSAWRSLALKCGDLFGLALFGVDCIETDDGLLVIEVNEFPNYSAVPDADQKLSHYVVASSTRQER